MEESTTKMCYLPKHYLPLLWKLSKFPESYSICAFMVWFEKQTKLHTIKPYNPYNIIHALLLATKVKAQPLGREAVTPRTAEHTVLGPLASSSATKLPGGHTLEEDTLLWLWHESLTKLPFRREKALARHHSTVKRFCQPFY